MRSRYRAPSCRSDRRAASAARRSASFPCVRPALRQSDGPEPATQIRASRRRARTTTCSARYTTQSRPSSRVNVWLLAIRTSVAIETLLDAQGRQLAQFVQKGRSLRHKLVHERQRVLRLLSNERAEAHGAQKERFTFLVGASVGRIARVLRQAFGAERLSGRRDPRYEPSSGANSTPQHDASACHDEHTIRHRTALIDRETRRPARPEPRTQRSRLARHQASRASPMLILPHIQPHIPLRVGGGCNVWAALDSSWAHRLLQGSVGDESLVSTARSASARLHSARGVMTSPWQPRILPVHLRRRRPCPSLSSARMLCSPLHRRRRCSSRTRVCARDSRTSFPRAGATSSSRPRCCDDSRSLAAGPAIQCSCPIVAHRLLTVGGDLRPVLLPLVPPPVAVARYVRTLAQPDAHANHLRRRVSRRGRRLDRHSHDARCAHRHARRARHRHRGSAARLRVGHCRPIAAATARSRAACRRAEALWTELGARTLVEVDGDDFVTEVAQHLLTGKNVLIDASARLGCACSGAVNGARHPRAHGRRARAAARDDAGRRRTSADRPGSARARRVAHAGRCRRGVADAAVLGAPDRRRPTESRRNSGIASARIRAGRRRLPKPRPPRTERTDRATSVLSAFPVARDVEGKSLPRAYVARRRSSPKGVSFALPPEDLRRGYSAAARAESRASGIGAAHTRRGARRIVATGRGRCASRQAPVHQPVVVAPEPSAGRPGRRASRSLSLRLRQLRPSSRRRRRRCSRGHAVHARRHADLRVARPSADLEALADASRLTPTNGSARSNESADAPAPRRSRPESWNPPAPPPRRGRCRAVSSSGFSSPSHDRDLREHGRRHHRRTLGHARPLNSPLGR